MVTTRVVIGIGVRLFFCFVGLVLNKVVTRRASVFEASLATLSNNLILSDVIHQTVRRILIRRDE